MRVAIPTEDGIRVSPRFGRASWFIVADVTPGSIVYVGRRANPAAVRTLARGKAKKVHKSRHHVVSELLADCRAVIANSIGPSMRQALASRGIEVVVTSEALVDRALALFSMAALPDESRFDPEDIEVLSSSPDEDRDSLDEFDG